MALNKEMTTTLRVICDNLLPWQPEARGYRLSFHPKGAAVTVNAEKREGLWTHKKHTGMHMQSHMWVQWTLPCQPNWRTIKSNQTFSWYDLIFFYGFGCWAGKWAICSRLTSSVWFLLAVVGGASPLGTTAPQHHSERGHEQHQRWF